MKWEYFAYKFFGNQELNTLKERMNVFKELGQDNWELVAVDGGIAYFKRALGRCICQCSESGMWHDQGCPMRK